MSKYLCMYREHGVPGVQYFVCSAEDAQHAKDQLFNSEPKAVDWTIFRCVKELTS